MARYGSYWQRPSRSGGIGGVRVAARSSGGRIASDVNTDAGKLTTDLSDPIGSIGRVAGSIGDFAGNIAGGLLGAVGQVGIPGGPNIGDIPEAAGEAIGAVGGVGLPGGDTLPTNPVLGGTLGGGGEANVGAIPGAMLDIIGAPARALERVVAGGRVEAARGGGRNLLADALAFAAGNLVPLTQGAAGSMTGGLGGLQGDTLPADIQLALDAGEITSDQAADALVARQAGFSNDPGVNLVASVVYDPTNLLSAGAGAVLKGAQKAGVTVRAMDRGGAAVTGVNAFVGRSYNVATHAMTRGQQSLIEKVVGPATQGVAHAYGASKVTGLLGGASKLAPEFGQRLGDALGTANAFFIRSVAARSIADDVAKKWLDADKFGDPGDIARLIDQRIGEVDRKVLTQMAEDDGRRFAWMPDGRPAEEIERETVEMLAVVMRAGDNDAARVLGKSVSDLQTQQLVRLAYWGHLSDGVAGGIRTASGEAVRATTDASGAIRAGQEAASQAENVAAGVARGGSKASGGAVRETPFKPLAADDYERLTPIAPDTLTVERADALGALKGDAFREEALRYGEFRKYLGDAYDEEKVRKLLGAMRDGDYLPATLVKPRDPTANPIPGALGDIRAEMNRFGYEMGFAPKSGWRTLFDADGNVISQTPFVRVTSDKVPLTVRNQFGRYMDNLFRGVNQTRIIIESRQRLVRAVAAYGVNASEAERIHQQILWRARDQRVAPRGLALGFGKPAELAFVADGQVTTATKGLNAFDEAFRDTLGDQRFVDLIREHDPTTLVMQAFEGNLGTIGLTQKVSGAAKSIPAIGRGIAAIAEGIYPLTKFRFNPLFQAQELIESPFLNMLRGVSKETVSPEIQRLYGGLAELDEFHWLSGAEYTLNTIGGDAIKRGFGQTTAGKIAAALPDVQGIKKHAQVAQVIAEHPDDFRATVQSVNPRLWQIMEDAYGTKDAAAITSAFLRERQALTGGNLADAMRVFDEAAPKGGDFALETVWNAFRESARRRSEIAFKTHYFSANRSFLERSINHPYLGLYPASYMYGKVLPEFARFLVLRPFGKNAPLAGMAALQKVQETYVAELTADPEFGEWVKENKDAIYLANMLLPGIPSDITARTPSWMRRLGTAAAKGNLDDPQDVAETATRAATDATAYAFGPLSSAPTFVGAGIDIGENLYNLRGPIEENLARAAALYDGMFSQR